MGKSEKEIENLKRLCPEAKDLFVAVEKFNLMLDGLPKQPMELYIEFLKEIDPRIGHHAIRVPVPLLRDMIEKYKAIADCILKLGAGLNEAYRALYGTENGNRAFDDFIEKERR